MWFEAHDDLPRNPHTLKLARLLKVHRREAVGLLYDLYCWGLQYAKPDGELTGMHITDISSALDISDKKAVSTVDALILCGFLTSAGDEAGTLSITDWEHIGGRISARRERDRGRKSPVLSG